MRVFLRIMTAYFGIISLGIWPYGLPLAIFLIWFSCCLGPAEENEKRAVRDEGYGYRQDKRWERIEQARRGTEIDPTRPH